MSTTSMTDNAADHKHWLAEIERWESYLRVWRKQQEEAAAEIAAWAKGEGRQLEEHARSIASLQQAIVDSERRMMANRGEANPAQDSEVAALHDRQRHAHERIKHVHHNLLACLAILKAKPMREE